jgi:hypothetical protein
MDPKVWVESNDIDLEHHHRVQQRLLCVVAINDRCCKFANSSEQGPLAAIVFLCTTFQNGPVLTSSKFLVPKAKERSFVLQAKTYSSLCRISNKTNRIPVPSFWKPQFCPHDVMA